ncbi:MAG: exosortase H-associated membrane protein [Rhodoferax sp.]
MKHRLTWKPPTSLWAFFASAIGLFLLATPLWMQVSGWTSYPSATLAAIVLDSSAPYWVRSVHTSRASIEVETRIEVAVPANLRQGQGTAELVAQADPAHYAYGLPLLLALLLASRSPHFFRRALAGYLMLLVPQAFSLIFEILRQITVAGGRAGALHIDQWQMEGIALGYQVGSLLLPTLAPVALWLHFERDFLVAVTAHGWPRRKPDLN